MQNTLCKFVVVVALFFVSGAGAAERAISVSHDDSDIEWGACPAFFPEGCQIAVLHGDPSKPDADIYFRIPGGYEFPAHWHTSAERMVLVSGELDVKYEGQETTHLKEGMYAYGPAKVVHDGKCVSKEQCVVVIAFEEPVDAYEQ